MQAGACLTKCQGRTVINNNKQPWRRSCRNTNTLQIKSNPVYWIFFPLQLSDTSTRRSSNSEKKASVSLSTDKCGDVGRGWRRTNKEVKKRWNCCVSTELGSRQTENAQYVQNIEEEKRARKAAAAARITFTVAQSLNPDGRETKWASDVGEKNVFFIQDWHENIKAEGGRLPHGWFILADKL